MSSPMFYTGHCAFCKSLSGFREQQQKVLAIWLYTKSSWTAVYDSGYVDTYVCVCPQARAKTLGVITLENEYSQRNVITIYLLSE